MVLSRRQRHIRTICTIKMKSIILIAIIIGLAPISYCAGPRVNFGASRSKNVYLSSSVQKSLSSATIAKPPIPSTINRQTNPKPLVTSAGTIGKKEIPMSTPRDSVGCGVVSPQFQQTMNKGTIDPSSWPWIVTVENEVPGQGTKICEGSLLRVKDGVEFSDIILTSAHCLTTDEQMRTNKRTFLKSSLKSLRVLLGGKASKRSKRTANVDNVRLYPGYDPITGLNDIGILKLDESAVFDEYIRPICLPRLDECITDQRCTVAGYGWGNVAGDNALQQLPIATWPWIKDCKRMWSRFNPDAMICGQSVDNRVSNRMEGEYIGESGGSLYCMESGRYIIHGISSVPSNQNSAQTSLYTRVSHYRTWISSVMQELSAVGSLESAPVPMQFISTPTVRQDVEMAGNVGCGLAAPQYQNTAGMTVGNAMRNSWPWLVTVLNTVNGNTKICDGSLVRIRDDIESTDIVLTSAHCLTIDMNRNAALSPSSTIRVSIGNSPLQTDQSRSVTDMRTHPNFNPGSGLNDIAILKLASPVQFDDNSRPICIPTQLYIGSTQACAVVGWGWGNPSGNDTIQQMSITSWPYIMSCERLWPQLNTATMVCGDSIERTKHSMNSMYTSISGGALYCVENGRWALNGLSSMKGDKATGIPSLFTRVNYYQSWISTTIQQLSSAVGQRRAK